MVEKRALLCPVRGRKSSARGSGSIRTGIPLWFFPATKGCSPTQCRGAEPLPNLVGHGIQPCLLLSLALIEQEPLPQPRFIQTTNTHPQESHG